jgi:hypothetical protein
VRLNARLAALLGNTSAWGSPPTGQLVSVDCCRLRLVKHRC